MPEAQRLGADERHEIALPLPGRRFAQRRRSAHRRPARASGGQERSSIAPGTKITVLPATENWPLPPLHQSSRTTSPAVADLQRRQPLRAGLTRGIKRHLQAEREFVLGVGWPAFKAAANRTEAASRAFENPCQQKSCNLSRNLRRVQRRATFYVDEYDIGQTGPKRKSLLQKQIPAALACGDSFARRGRRPISGPSP
mgnify:CR=1 FL=1